MVPSRLERVAKSRDIWRPQLSESNVLVLVSGLIGAFRQARNGARQITSIHVSGDIMGLERIMTSHLPLGLQALGDASFLILSLTDLRRLADRYPAISMAFWRECVSTSEIIAERLFAIRSLDAYSRTAHLFCELAIRSDAIPSKGSNSFSFSFGATQQHLSDVLALTPIHVNRMLRELRERSVMTLQNRLVTIHNWDLIQRIANFDPAYLQPSYNNAGAD